MLKRTPLYPVYAGHGARVIDFGGWELPVQFAGIQKEHDAVRQQAGLFDVSHMGEVRVAGRGSLRFLQQLTTNDVSKLTDGQCQYSLMCYPDGGVVDDLLVYRLKADEFMLVINAANIDKDLNWMREQLVAWAAAAGADGEPARADGGPTRTDGGPALAGQADGSLHADGCEEVAGSETGGGAAREKDSEQLPNGEAPQAGLLGGATYADGRAEVAGSETGGAAARAESGDVELTDISAATVLLALQGPHAARILSRLTAEPVAALKPFRFLPAVDVSGVQALISRTGYTGEDGFELYAAADDGIALWQALLAAGSEDGLTPAGLGARDTLRFEARLPLYGQELGPDITPLEAGLTPFVKLDKGEFIGRAALAAQQAAGVPRKLVGLEVLERGIPRPGYAVYADGRRIGTVTTGTQSPTLKRNIGLALIEAAYAAPGTELRVDVRGTQLQAAVVTTPFYKKTSS